MKSNKEIQAELDRCIARQKHLESLLGDEGHTDKQSQQSQRKKFDAEGFSYREG